MREIFEIIKDVEIINRELSFTRTTECLMTLSGSAFKPNKRKYLFSIINMWRPKV